MCLLLNHMIKFLLISRLLIVLVLCFPLHLYASGPYDGIYSITLRSTSYVSIHEDSATNQVVVMLLNTTEPTNYSWSAYTGIRSGNSVMLDSIRGVSDNDTVAKVRVVFNTDGSATVTILSCVDGVNYYCSLPPGVTFTAYRIF